MKKVLIAAALAAATATLSSAQNGTPSSKATAAINTAVGCSVSSTSNIGETLPVSCHDVFSGASVPVTPDNFVTVMSAPIKVSNSQSLFVSPSLVTGLYTNTTVRTKTGSTSSTTAAGGVYMRAVLTDPKTNAVLQVAYPVAACTSDILGCQQSSAGQYGVVLDSRVQTLSQTLSDCVVKVGDTTGTCEFDSTINLILDTTSAHTFNFVFPNVGVGVYNVAIQTAVNSDAAVNTGSGSAIGAAAYGLGSLTVDSVRLVHDFSF
jgi:hypothetical protein